jgi:hypothetical protein
MGWQRAPCRKGEGWRCRIRIAEHRKRSPIRGLLWYAAAAGVAAGLPLIFVLAGMAAERLPVAKQIPVAVVLVAAAAGSILAARRLHRRGARHRAPGGDDAMSIDRRAPVLYLRSFAAEDEVWAEEEALARVLRDAGPFVAIGKPGEELPPIGASRLYSAEAARRGWTWQEIVRDLLGRAALIVVAPGVTEGLTWEVRQCRALVDPLRLIVLVPSRDVDYERFRSEVVAPAPLDLPAFPAAHARRFAPDRFVGLLRFDREWHCRFAPFAERKGRLSDVDHVDLREARLRAGLRRSLQDLDLGIRSDRRRTRFAIWCLWAVYLVSAIIAVVLWLLW